MKVYVLMVREWRSLVRLELLANKEDALAAARRECRRMVVKDFLLDPKISQNCLFLHHDLFCDNMVEVFEKEMMLPKPALDIPISLPEFLDPFDTPEYTTVIQATDPPPILKPELLGYDPADPELMGGYDDDDFSLLVKDILKDSTYFKRMSELTEDQKTALVAHRIGASPDFQALLPGLGLFDRDMALAELTLGTEAGKKIVELDCQALAKTYAVDRAR
jgi:hypothetical protein